MNRNRSRKVSQTRCRVTQTLVLGNHKRNFIPWLFAGLLVSLNAPAGSGAQIQAQAQTGDWEAVQNLKRNTRIVVKAHRVVHCFFKIATDDELVCKPPRFFFIGRAEARFDRQSVREVRIERNQENDGWTGAGIGMGAGAAVGAKTISGTGPIVDAALGAFLGGTVASAVPIFHRDKTIYKR